MSLIEGFAVQKWIRDRGWTKETVANKGNDDRRDDLQLIFNHLDTTRRGKISLCAIRGALSMVKLSEDPARHAHLSENIVSCFSASDQPKSAAGGAVDFTQFADVMACQEQGKKFQTLQDELRSEGLAAAKAHFANIFRKEVVVRGLLDNGGAAGFMCSVFQMLFKAEGLAASSSDRARKLRLMEEAAEDRKARRLERKRAEQAKQKLVESRPTVDNSSRLPAQVPSSRDITSHLPISSVDDVPNMSGVSREDAETPPTERDPDGEPPAVKRRSRRRQGQPALLQQNAYRSRAEVNIRLKKEAIRQASAVLGVQYVPPSPPSTTSPATKISNKFRGRAWWLGSSSSNSNSNSNSSVSGGTAFAKGDRAGSKMLAARATPGGFVRHPAASVRRLRLRPQRPSPAVGLPHRGKRGAPSFGGDPDDPENKGIKAFGTTCRRKDAIMKRTPLCGRSANASLPSWASCDNSACDPVKECNNSTAGKTADAERAEEAREVRLGSGATTAGAPEQEAAVETASSAEEGRGRHDSGLGPPKTTILSASTMSNCGTTTPTIITAVVPTATKAEHCEQTTPGAGQRRVVSRGTSYSSLATVPPETAKSAAETSHHPEPGKEETHLSPRRPDNPNPSLTGKATRGSSRPHGSGESAGAAPAEKWRRLYQNPWRTPLLVRCMRRPEPRVAQPPARS